MSLPLPNPAPRRRADASPLDAYARRRSVTVAHVALLDLIEELSVKRGFCYAGQAFMAERLDVSDRHVRRLITELHAMGCLSIVHRRARTSLLRVLKRPEADDATIVLKLAPPDPADGPPPPVENGGKPVANALRIGETPRTLASAPPGHGCPPRSGHSCPPRELREFQIGGHSDGPGQGRLPFDGAKTYFNPRRPWSITDQWHPLQRLAYGFKTGRLLFTQINGEVRTLCSVDWTERHARVGVVDESGPDLPPQFVVVSIEQLDSWTWWR